MPRKKHTLKRAESKWWRYEYVVLKPGMGYEAFKAFLEEKCKNGYEIVVVFKKFREFAVKPDRRFKKQ